MSEWVDHPRVQLERFNAKIEHYRRAEVVGDWLVYFTGLAIYYLQDAPGPFLRGQWVAVKSDDGTSMTTVVWELAEMFGRRIRLEDVSTHHGRSELMVKVQDFHEKHVVPATRR